MEEINKHNIMETWEKLEDGRWFYYKYKPLMILGWIIPLDWEYE